MSCFTLRRWDDQIEDGRYEPRGWWVRVGDGWGLSYRNLSMAGHKPLFSERYGHDRTIAVRVGPHLFKLLTPPRRSR